MGYTFSKHALERYASRMQDYDSQIDVTVFIASRNEEIKERLTKLIEHSKLVYTGRSTTDYNKEIVDVYLNRDGWVIIIDHKKSNVITIFQITLGLDDDFDKEYLNRIFEKLDEITKSREDKLTSINVTENTYKDIVQDNEKQINEVRTQLKNLEKIKSSYEEVLSNLKIERDMADKELRSFIAKLLGKKVF